MKLDKAYPEDHTDTRGNPICGLGDLKLLPEYASR